MAGVLNIVDIIVLRIHTVAMDMDNMAIGMYIECTQCRKAPRGPAKAGFRLCKKVPQPLFYIREHGGSNLVQLSLKSFYTGQLHLRQNCGNFEIVFISKVVVEIERLLFGRKWHTPEYLIIEFFHDKCRS
jgi:hypothetical protein